MQRLVTCVRCFSIPSDRNSTPTSLIKTVFFYNGEWRRSGLKGRLYCRTQMLVKEPTVSLTSLCLRWTHSSTLVQEQLRGMGTAAGDSKIRLTGLKNLKRRARFSARLVSIKSREKTSVGLTQVTCLSLRRPPWPVSWVLCSHMRSPGTGCRDCIPAEKSIIREHPLL